MIRLKAINKIYKTKGRPQHHALIDIDLHVPKGSIYGIIGRSGAGKSSLIRLLNLLEKPSSGTITLDGQDITHLRGGALRSLRQRIGMVFQHFNLLNSRTVMQNVCFPLRLKNIPKAERQQKALQLLELVGLKEHADKYPRQLSGGQKQRVGIARALANDPEVLLCDEATSALDPETTQAILNLLLDINQRLNLTIVLITHGMDVIRAICDEVAVIEQGRIIEQGKVIDVFLHPQHATTQSLLLESSALDGEAWRSYQTSSAAKYLRLSYQGDTTAEPLISRLSKDLDVDISILQGTVSKLKDIAYGQLIIAVNADQQQYKNIQRYFEAHDVMCEELSA
ncbi:methionine ABC transporter ATP-binding protein [Brackiella oedipodis]|uniref:methionine ABC transporter ATP-binding protein n=1 Tax=Brackiella oedipodis TaxID=124225 RepID=UPI00056F7C4F|nr:ATP-binding cassette domain-containing protein [Brackiella oedipodis]